MWSLSRLSGTGFSSVMYRSSVKLPPRGALTAPSYSGPLEGAINM